jgi:hypothetical protein
MTQEQAWARIERTVRSAMRGIALSCVKNAKDSLVDRPPSAAGRPPGTRRGFLRNSIAWEMDSDATVRVGIAKGSPAAHYAKIQEFGGTVAPRHGGKLRFPVLVGSLWPAATGQRRRSAKLLTEGGTRSLAGRGLLVGRTYRFVTKASVTLPRRPYLRPAAERTRTEVPAIVTSVTAGMQ